MQALGPQELEAVTDTLVPITKDKEVIATCAYGSRVAGYATKDSDYDVIVVLRPFAQRIKYFYFKGRVDCSALVIDPKSFENDCRKSTLGEFASGRLLNTYEPISGEAYLRENEVAYKKRVVLEGLSEVYADYLNFASEINFPLKYFLFEKLRKRAAIYPPVVYSYSKTYSGDLLKENVEASLVGFEEAAEALKDEGLVSFDEASRTLKISPQNFHAGIAVRIGAAASYTTKSLRQYAVHGYAGRVRPGIVGKEVMSKLSKSRRTGKLPDYIKNPKQILTLPEGKLFVGSRNWLSDLISYFGMNEETCKVKTSSLGEIYNSAGFYTLEEQPKDGEPSSSDENKKSIKIAVKRFKDIKGMKWGVLSLWSLKSTNFTANAMERLGREYAAIRELRNFGLSTPDMLAVFLPQMITVTRFVSGRDLSKIETEYFNGTVASPAEDLNPIYQFGKDLATMHNNGYCMGDTKPSNAVLSDADSKIYLTDLEQSHKDGNKTWDIAEFIYYSVRFTLKEERARKLVNAFISGYMSKAEDPKVLNEVALLRYRAPFQAFIAPNVMNAVRKDLTR